MVECEYSVLNDVSFSDIGFNRYMVECEFIPYDRLACRKEVLIDTWWNVNDFDIFRYANLFAF